MTLANACLTFLSRLMRPLLYWPEPMMITPEPEPTEEEIRRQIERRLCNMIENVQVDESAANKVVGVLAEYAYAFFVKYKTEPVEAASFVWQHLTNILGKEYVMVCVVHRAIENGFVLDLTAMVQLIHTLRQRTDVFTRHLEGRELVNVLMLRVFGLMDVLRDALTSGLVHDPDAVRRDGDALTKALWLIRDPANVTDFETATALNIGYYAGKSDLSVPMLKRFVKNHELGYGELPKLVQLLVAEVVTPAVMDTFLDRPLSFGLFTVDQLIEQLREARAEERALRLCDMLEEHSITADDISLES